MSGLGASWLLALKRLSAHRRTSLAVAFGILLAAVVLAFVPAYQRAMADLGLRFSVSERAGDTAYFNSVATGRAIGGALDQVEQRQREAIAAQVGWFVEPVDQHIKSRVVTIELPDGSSPNFYINALLGMESRVNVLEGRLPAPGAGLEAALGQPIAEALGLGVGDTLTLTLAYTDCFPPAPPDIVGAPPPPPCNATMSGNTRVAITITGIIEAAEPQDPFWSQVPADPARIEQIDAGFSSATIYSITLPYETVRTTLAEVAPGLAVTGTLIYSGDPTSLSAANVDDARARIAALSADLRTDEVFTISTMDEAFRAYDQSARFSAAPILILSLQIAAVVILYVGIVAALLAEELIDETALLRGRGASLGQVFALAALEGLTFAVPAALVAPFIAAGLVTLLGYTPVFEDAAGGEALPFSLTGQAFALAAAGAFIATLALALPVAISARQRFQEGRRRQARASGRPFYQKYFLDFGVIGVALMLIYQLYRQDTVFERDSFGGLSSDPLLLFAPAIFSLATVAIVLRLFPIAARVAARALRPVTGPAGDLALTNLSRASGGYARLVVLLTLVFALGAFAATYAPTVDRSYEERARYEAGPELRTSSLGRVNGLPQARVEESFGGLNGVNGALAVWRGTGALGVDQTIGNQLNILAFDASRAASFVDIRDDFSTAPINELLGSLPGPGYPPGMPIPGEPEAILVDIHAGGRAQSHVWARVRDGEGRYHLVDLGNLGGEGWQTYTGSFPDTFTLVRRDGVIAYPLSLVSLYLSDADGVFRPGLQPILFDNIRALEGGVETVIESFEQPELRWGRWATSPRLADGIESVALAEAPEGSRVLQFTTSPGRSPAKRGIYFRSLGLPIAAVASQSFVNVTGAGPGSIVEVAISRQVVPVVITGVVDLFPTLAPGGRGFLIMDSTALYGWGEVTGQEPTTPTEVWLDLREGASPEAVIAAMRSELRSASIVNRAALIRTQTSNPIISAGASGLLGFGFVAAFSVLCLAVVLTLILDAERRTVSTSVLRAVGLSPRSVFAALAIEYSVVVTLGVALGVALGLQVGEVMLRFLEVTERGLPVVPPFVLETNFGILWLAVGLLVTVMAGSVIAAGVYLRQVSVARAVRLSE